MSDVTDTMLNLWVFAFVALVIWLILKPAAGLKKTNTSSDNPQKHQ
ncbi:MAG: hypothetical protein ACR2PG_15850 [Hyphomicrobiaceae bacterium]